MRQNNFFFLTLNYRELRSFDVWPKITIDNGKKSFALRGYESVNDKSPSWVTSQISTEDMNSGLKC